MELDTGATVSVISRQQFKKLRPPSKLEPTAVRLKTYTEVVQPCGVFNVAVRYKDQVGDLPLCVVDYGAPALLGREWLETFRLDWDEICGLHKLCNDSHPDASQEDHGTRQRALLDIYSTIFDDTLGKIEGADQDGSTQPSCSGRGQCRTRSRCRHPTDPVRGGDTRTTCYEPLLRRQRRPHLRWRRRWKCVIQPLKLVHHHQPLSLKLDLYPWSVETAIRSGTLNELGSHLTDTSHPDSPNCSGGSDTSRRSFVTGVISDARSDVSRGSTKSEQLHECSQTAF
ncbi:uncharacterized protein [Dermacentor andersoni]|uniref:uncharacterized protein n=1 Tax=Dermacentor andersoni TaxID=34620 RepID=UPI003B3B53E3